MAAIVRLYSCLASLWWSALAREIKLGYLYIQGGPSADNGYSASWVQESFSQFKLGIQDVNSNASILPGDTLVFDAYDTNGQESKALQGAIDLIAGGVIGIVGTGYSSALPFPGGYCSIAKIPIVSPGSTFVELSDKTRFPYLLRSISSDVSVMKAMGVLVADVTWRRAAVLVSRKFEGGALQVLRPALEAQNIGFLMLVYSEALDSDLQPIHENIVRLRSTMDLVRSSGYKIIVNYVPDVELPIINETASSIGIGFRSLEYVWMICSSTLPSFLYSEPQIFGFQLRSSAVSRKAWYDARWTAVTTRWNESIHGGYNTSTGLPFYGSAMQSATVWDTDYAPVGDGAADFWGQFVYDTVWLYALALDAITKAGGDIHDGAALREELLATKFEGVTGDLAFDQAFQDRVSPLNFVMSSNGGSDAVQVGVATDQMVAWNMAGPCGAGCSTIDPSALPWPAGSLPSDGRTLDIQKCAVIAANLPFIEGTSIVIVVQTRDSFEKAPCRDVCSELGRQSADCLSCLADFANVDEIDLQFSELPTNTSVFPAAAPVYTQDIASGQISIELPEGLSGAGVEDRLIKFTVLYRGEAVRKQQELQLKSSACSVGWMGMDGSCRECSPGSHAAIRGQTACTLCGAGYFQAEEGASECHPCGLGSFAASVGLSACTRCSVGSFAARPGSSVCTSCNDFMNSTTQLWSTMQKVSVKGQEEWVHAEGASSKASCGCDRDARLERGDCAMCGEGMSCGGMGDIEIIPGFSSDPTLSVFMCYGDVLRCPGGPPGDTCAEGRVGVACAECSDGKTPSSDGSCVDCGGSDSAPFTLACLLGVVVLACVYGAVARLKDGAASQTMQLCAISLGQLLALTQQLAVLSMFAVPWDEPLASLMSAMKLFAFDIEVLRLSCVASASELARIAMKVCIVIVGGTIIAMIHSISVLVWHGGRFREHMHTLIAAEGTIFSMFYIAILCTILGPFQCTKHPNGKWTARAYQNVVCWEGDHGEMIAVGVVGFLLVNVFLAKCVAVVCQYRKKMIQMDVSFLRSYGFLFFRFTPKAYFYVLALMARTIVIAVTPVIPSPVAQVSLFQLMCLCSLSSIIYLRPWRLPFTNLVDAILIVVMLLLTNVSAFFVDVQDVTILAWLSIIITAAFIIAIVGVILRTVVTSFARKPNRFQFFLCHHKAGAGAFTRLLKTQLAVQPQVSREVFLDSDNLDDLANLLDYVGYNLDQLVVIASAEIFMRPWCAGEMTTARLRGVTTVVVPMPDHISPSDDFIANYTEHVDISCLTDYNISEAMVAETLRWIQGVPVVSMDTSAVTFMTSAVVAKLTGCDPQKIQLSDTNGPPAAGTQNFVVADEANLEATAAAHLLRILLVPHFKAIELFPVVVDSCVRHAAFPEGGRRLVAICSAGCFQQAAFLKVLAGAYDAQMETIPVVVEASFKYPTPDFLSDLAWSCPQLPQRPDGEDVEDFVLRLISSVFQEIASSFIAQHASDVVLKTAASKIATRLHKDGIRTSERVVSTSSQGIRAV